MRTHPAYRQRPETNPREIQALPENRAGGQEEKTRRGAEAEAAEEVTLRSLIREGEGGVE